MMDAFPLETARLTLDQPTAADVDDIARFCAEPVFDRFMVTPWPYERQHAVGFIEEYVPNGWAQNTEWTWAIREHGAADLLGVISVRLDGGMVGYWLGALYRGRGILPEALETVVDAVFARTELDRVRWECTRGNVASLGRAEDRLPLHRRAAGPHCEPRRLADPGVDGRAAAHRRPRREAGLA